MRAITPRLPPLMPMGVPSLGAQQPQLPVEGIVHDVHGFETERRILCL
jgi:hypothetical protein